MAKREAHLETEPRDSGLALIEKGEPQLSDVALGGFILGEGRELDAAAAAAYCCAICGRETKEKQEGGEEEGGEARKMEEKRSSC